MSLVTRAKTALDCVTRLATRSMATALPNGFAQRHVCKGMARLSEDIVERGEGVMFRFGAEGRHHQGHCHLKISKVAAEHCLSPVHGQVNYPPSRFIPSLLSAKASAASRITTLSEAVEAAPKMVPSIMRKNTVTMQGAFRVRTFGAMTITKSKTLYADGSARPSPPFALFRVPTLFDAECTRDITARLGDGAVPLLHHINSSLGSDDAELVRKSLYQLELLLFQQSAPSDTAAVVVEPMLGEGGYVPAPPAFFQGLRDICDKNCLLLVVDKVQSLFERTGRMFNIEDGGVRPDLLITVKGLANGFSRIAVVDPKDLADKLRPGKIVRLGSTSVEVSGGTCTSTMPFNGGIIMMAMMSCPVGIVGDRKWLPPASSTSAIVPVSEPGLYQDKTSLLQARTKQVPTIRGIQDQCATRERRWLRFEPPRGKTNEPNTRDNSPVGGAEEVAKLTVGEQIPSALEYTKPRRQGYQAARSTLVVPAISTNATDAFIADGLNVTDISAGVQYRGSLASARIIISRLEVVNTSVYGEYNPTILNASQAAINDTLAAGYPTAPGYLWATLAAYNATTPLGINNSGSDAQGTQTGGGGGTGSSKTTHAITRLYPPGTPVSYEFCGMLMHGQSGNLHIIRAVRHPEERYRAAGSGDDPLALAELADVPVPPARPRARPSGSVPRATSAADPQPELIGYETCPICIVDFDDGDDVRVLPCEGKHVFHQACVDPWLLMSDLPSWVEEQDPTDLPRVLAPGEGPGQEHCVRITPVVGTSFPPKDDATFWHYLRDVPQSACSHFTLLLLVVHAVDSLNDGVLKARSLLHSSYAGYRSV
ncbi:aminotransferase class-III-domain-containing protein [Lactarius psammicola]|nr:aminotransferase class-III-domain-containing protein [Lactarius psammicola]